MKAILLYFCMIGSALAQAYPYHGCYPDAGQGGGPRSLPVELMASGATVETCAQAAGSKYPYFGLQAGGECFAGTDPGTIGPASNCSMPCTADATQRCGGSWANSVYSARMCSAGSYMTGDMPFMCSPIKGICPSNVVLGAACPQNVEDSCYTVDRKTTPPKIQMKFCDGNWIAAPAVNGIVK